MQRHSAFPTIGVVILLYLSVAFLAATPGEAVRQVAGASAADGPAALTEKLCSPCHPTSGLTVLRKSRSDWERVVDEMTSYGMVITADESRVVVDYLATAFETSDAKRAAEPGSGGKDALSSGAQRTVKGTWQLASYTRDGQELDWTGYMILTNTHFSRIYMAKNRYMFPLPEREVLEAEWAKIGQDMVRNYSGSTGVYRLKDNRVNFEVLASGAQGNGGQHLRLIHWTADDLVLSDDRAGVPQLREVWRRLVD